MGAESWFVYGLDPAPHARTGRRPPGQQHRLQARPRRETIAFGRRLNAVMERLFLAAVWRNFVTTPILPANTRHRLARAF